jgi:sugar diacid utilization regulator
MRLKTTQYFQYTRQRPDRATISEDWIIRVILHPLKEERQSDGRIRRWARIEEMDNRALRVILLEDGETVHNAFFDRDFKE